MVRDVIREIAVPGPRSGRDGSGRRTRPPSNCGSFLYERVYDNPTVHDDFVKASKMLEELYDHFLDQPEWFQETLAQKIPGAAVEDLAADFIAGMTDRYALALYESSCSCPSRGRFFRFA